MNTNLVFFQFLMVSNAFQISSLWRKGKKKENQLKDCRSDECKVKQAACLQDCQRGQAKGLGFCTAVSSTYTPFIEKYGEGYARENDGYLENLISKFCFTRFYTYFQSFQYLFFITVASLEGLFVVIAGYCGDEDRSLCLQCGPGITFRDILRVQNITESHLIESENQVAELQNQLAMLTKNITELTQSLQMPEQAMVKMLMYEEVLQQTDQILYW